jgi:uncharacterized protein (TIGR03435 family)
MRRPAMSAGKLLDESLGKFSNVSADEIEFARAQALTFLESNPSDGSPQEMPRVVRPIRHSRWFAVATIAAAVTLAIFIPARALRSAPAILEEATGSRDVEYGEVVRGGTLRFPDGSRVQVHPESAVSLERADGGVRLSLYKGQVAVLAGEAVVQQGETSRTLRAGEQIQSPPIGINLLLGGSETEPQLAFTTASVRLVAPQNGGRGSVPSLTGCSGLPPRVDPAMASFTANLYTLITSAYTDGGCLYVAALDLLKGGPAWARSDQYAIRATMPDGFHPDIPNQLGSGNAPKVQAMLRRLLEDRFNLVLRREQKEMQVLLLKVAKNKTTLIPAADGDKVFSGSRQQTDSEGHRYMKVEGGKATMANLTSSLTLALLRPVLDRTGIVGEFNFAVEYDSVGVLRPALPDALKEQLGLELEETKALVEYLVIDRLDRPSEN